VQAVGGGLVVWWLWFSDVSALEVEDRRTNGLTAGLTAYAMMRYINRRSLPSLRVHANQKNDIYVNLFLPVLPVNFY